jgi:Ni/Fe-hydrogenase 1 B-type cytochrome subunit
MVIMVATGFYIHKPNFSLLGIDMNLARYMHFITAFAILLNSVTRIYWSIFGAPRDIKYFLPEKENKGKMFPMMAYYYFLRKTKPKTSKYNGWQKSTYVIWTIALWFMALTGFAMLWNTNPFLASVVAAFGGLAMIHAIHYLVMWFLVASVLFHIYLVLFDDFKSFLSMFFGIEPEEEEAY